MKKIVHSGKKLKFEYIQLAIFNLETVYYILVIDVKQSMRSNAHQFAVFSSTKLIRN